MLNCFDNATGILKQWSTEQRKKTKRTIEKYKRKQQQQTSKQKEHENIKHTGIPKQMEMEPLQGTHSVAGIAKQKGHKIKPLQGEQQKKQTKNETMENA